MTKRFTLMMAVLLVLAVPVAWAAGQPEAADPDAPRTLVVWDFKYGEVDGMQPPMIEIDRMFEEAFPNVTVDHVAQPHDEYYQVLRAAVTAGSGPDVVMFHGGARAWEFDQFLEPLDDYIEHWRHEISDFTWAAASYQGDPDNPVKVVPLTTQGLGWYYSKPAFEQAGLDPERAPRNKDEFLDAAQALKDAGITPIITGMAPENTFLSWGLRVQTVNAWPGDEVLRWRDPDMDFSNPDFVEAVDFFDELHRREFIDPQAYDMPLFMEAIEKFAGGEGGFFLGLLSDIAHWKDFEDGLGRGNVGYFPTVNLPGHEATDRQYLQGVGIGYAIMQWSRNKDIAAEYLKFYGSDGASVLVEMVGALHPNQAIDLSDIDYPSLDVIMGYMDNAQDAFNTWIPPAADQNAIARLSQSWMVADDLTARQWIERANEILAQERAQQ